VNNAYIQRGEMKFSVLEGFWSDAGTFESLFRASEMIHRCVNYEESENQFGQLTVTESEGQAKSLKYWEW